MESRIAVLITCYNRKETTLSCLKRLQILAGNDPFEIKAFLVDDGSADGTGDAVRAQFPEVHLQQGDGTLYWCGSFRLAFKEAFKQGFDFYLWLNDDTMLHDFALRKLLQTHANLKKKLKKDAIVVGSVSDLEGRELTYGGKTWGSRFRPTNYKLIQPSDKPKKCDVWNGNVVLVPAAVAKAVGNMSADFKQGPGDIDYAIRARRLGYESWICPGYVGKCSKNTFKGSFAVPDLSMQERLNVLKRPVVQALAEDWLVFVKTYHKVLWPYFSLTFYIRTRHPVFYIRLKTFGSSITKRSLKTV